MPKARCPGCGCLFIPEKKDQPACSACQIRQDKQQRYLIESQGVSVGAITSRGPKPREAKFKESPFIGREGAK